MSFAYGETITRLRAPLVTDTYSAASTRRDWAAATSTLIAGCAVSPGESQETQTVDRESVDTGPRLFAPFGTDIVQSDRIVSTTGTWDVVGHGQQWSNPFTGWQPGASFPLRRVDG